MISHLMMVKRSPSTCASAAENVMLEHRNMTDTLVQQLTKQVQQLAEEVSQLHVMVNDKSGAMKGPSRSSQCRGGVGPDPQCWNCGEYGHVWHNCSKRGGSNYRVCSCVFNIDGYCLRENV